MSKFNLVIVDLQYDFYDPCGSMYVNGAYDLPDKIGSFIEKHKDDINKIIFTLDWHTPKHSSFTEQGGPWPAHCIEYSRGASLPQDLLNKINSLDIITSFFEKGHYDEEYGAFANINYRSWDKYDLDEPNYYVLANESFDSSVSVYSTNGEFNFVVCGLCGDYCVMETMKNLMKVPKFNIKVFKDGILSIDNGEKFENFIKENNIKTIE